MWEDIDAEFGDNGISNPYPHFTLYGLGDADLDAVVETVERVADEHGPFSVRTDGVGVFPGNHAYIPVTHSNELGNLHTSIVDELTQLGDSLMPFYEPGSWFPHIGLALGVDDDQISDVVSFLLDYDFAWEFVVDNIEIEHRPEDESEFERIASIDL